MLVQQEDFGRHHGGHEQGQRLTLSAGQQTHRLAHPVLQPHVQLSQLVPEKGPVGPARAAEKGVLVLGGAQVGQSQILLDGHVGGGALHGVLEQPPQLPAALVLRLEGDILPVQHHGAPVGEEHPGDGVEQGGLARPVGAHHGDEVPGGQVEIYPVQRLLLVDGAGVEGLGDIVQLQHLAPSFRRASFCRWRAMSFLP